MESSDIPVELWEVLSTLSHYKALIRAYVDYPGCLLPKLGETLTVRRTKLPHNGMSSIFLLNAKGIENM